MPQSSCLSSGVKQSSAFPRQNKFPSRELWPSISESNFSLSASVLPGGAELFWSTEKVTITQGLRRSLESGCFPVSKCISAAQSSLKVEILPGPNFVSVLSPIIYDEEIICFIKQNALREELEFLFCLKSRFSYERLTF